MRTIFLGSRPLTPEMGQALAQEPQVRQESPKEVTADFVYIRLHGPGDAYQGEYDAQTLSGWAGAIHTWLENGKNVFCFFDNDQNGYAVKDAMKLKNMIE